jgi:uncharacterized membrane protein YccC
VGTRSTDPAKDEVAAPHWLVQLLRPRPAPIDVKRSVRAAFGIGTPIALGLLFGHLAVGVQISIGALCATNSYAPGPYRNRALRMVMGTTFGATGYFLGGLVGNGWVGIALVVAVAVVSALISVAGNNASFAALQLLIFCVLGSGQAGAGVGPYLSTLFFAIGACWVLLLALGAWPVRATGPERELLAEVDDAIADLLEAAGTDQAGPARLRLTTAMNAAYDALLAARSRMEGRDLVYRKLLHVLTETTPIVEAAVALAGANHRPPRSVSAAVRAVGDAIREETAPGELDLPDSPSLAVRSLVAGLQNVADLLAGGGRASDRARKRPSVKDRIDGWLDQLTAGPATWLFALRLALCIGLAEMLPVLLGLQRSYWVPLTVAIVLKPDFGSVFGRAVLRGGGTMVGVGIGALVLAIAPPGWLLVLIIAGLAALLPIGQVRNYGMFSTFVTPLVILQLDLAQAGSWQIATERLVDTTLGCVIVLVVGYLLWPGSGKPRIGPRLAGVVDTLADYAGQALTGEKGRSSLRRRTYRALSDLRTEFQRVLAEPSAAGRQAAAWWPVIVGLERTTDEVTAVAVRTERGAPPPPAEEVEALVAAIRETAAAVREQREPEEPGQPESDELADVGAALAGVYSALRGPRLDPRRSFAAVRRWLPRGRRR